ncbi:MAG TPA: hypothetical protein EYG86_09905 [Crocinitomicaceae bacterium]|nr:hypothetical protein [Crocinitomicaceae bacterium]
MQLLDFIFHLGVLFAIYGFLWGLLEAAIMLLSVGRVRSLIEIYLIRGVKYFFLVDVTFLFCFENDSLNMVELNRVVFAGIILLTYFVGKLQKNQNRSVMFNLAGGLSGRPMMKKQTSFNLRLETIIIAVSLIAFTFFWFYPEFAVNPIAEWLHGSIINIEDTPVFGFIFKVIGFFFLMSLIFKMVNTVTFLMNGGKVNRNGTDDFDDSNSLGGDDHFDDFEEVED